MKTFTSFCLEDTNRRVALNPFAPSQNRVPARFNVPGGAFESIKIFNIKGRLGRVLKDIPEWDGRDESGRDCEGGIYLFQIDANGFRHTGTMVIIR